MKAAKMQETLFTHSINIALNRTIEDLSNDRKTCRMIRSTFLCTEKNMYNIGLLSMHERQKVDSLLKHNLNKLQITLDYEFEILNESAPFITSRFERCVPDKCYQLSMEKAVQQTNFKINIHFPKKSEFVYAQMGTMFITSLILIGLLSFSFILIIRLYKTEIKLAEITKDFINNMAHEFKTPVTTIALASNMIKKENKELVPERIIRYAQMISFEIEKMKKHFETILQISCMEQNSFRLSFNIVDLHSVLNEAIHTIEIQITENGGLIKKQFDAQKVNVFGDKLQLVNIFLNLLDNANKYSRENPCIKVQTYNKNNSIIVSVSDNGIGIKAEDQKTIFEKFYRVSTGDIHNVKGFGLGLTFVKNVLDAHSGEISVSSELNKGTTFEISLALSGNVE
jgi:two-component system phosphate regulon sensor histidine kinase PhoR